MLRMWPLDSPIPMHTQATPTRLSGLIQKRHEVEKEHVRENMAKVRQGNVVYVNIFHCVHEILKIK